MLKDVEDILEIIADKWKNEDKKNMLNVLERREEILAIEKDRRRRLDIGIECLQQILPTCRKKCLHCTLCNSLYIPLVNSFSICLICEQEVCSNCIKTFKSPSDMELCRVCHVERLQKLKSGKWFNEIADDGNPITIIELESKLSVIKNKMETTVQYDVENDQLPNGSTLKQKVQTRKAKFKDDYEDSINDMSSNSTPSTAETFSLSNPLQTDRRINPIVKRPVSTAPSNVSTLRSSSYSMGQGSVKSFSMESLGGGEISLMLGLLQKPSQLQITIYKCKDLETVNISKDIINPYIVMYLLPDQSSNGKRKSSVKKKTSNPVYNETFSYRVDKMSLNDRTLNISVWNCHDSQGDIFIGETNIVMSELNLKDSLNIWLPLQTKENVPNFVSRFVNKGEMLLGLRYDKGAVVDDDESSQFDNGKLTIYIKNCKNLSYSKSIPNSYVKCSLIYKESVKSIRKTKVMNQTTNPVWDEKFCYDDIDKNDLFESTIELLVISKAKMSKEKMLGKIILKKAGKELDAVNCKEYDVLFWNRFLIAPNSKIIQDYLPLRACID